MEEKGVPHPCHWYHQQTQTLHPAVHDEYLQTALLNSLADYTGSTIARH